MGKIQVYNKKFQNSKLNKISFWLKQVFIEKNKWFLLRGNNHSVTLFQFMQFPGLAYVKVELATFFFRNITFNQLFYGGINSRS